MNYRWLIPVFAAGSLVTASWAAEEGTGSLGADDGAVCGPRCVRFLEGYYGKAPPTDLVDIVREIQWPNIEHGAALEDLRDALEERGIGTWALRVPPGSELCWPHPMIVHLGSQRGRDEASGGHYIVWLPTSSIDEVDVWEALPGGAVKRIPARELQQSMSGIVLLTAPDRIESPEGAFTPRWQWYVRVVVPNVLVLAALSCLLLTLRMPARRGTNGRHAFCRGMDVDVRLKNLV